MCGYRYLRRPATIRRYGEWRIVLAQKAQRDRWSGRRFGSPAWRVGQSGFFHGELADECAMARWS